MDDAQMVPPGQTLRTGLKVQHYGPVPRPRRDWILTFRTASPAPPGRPVVHGVATLAVTELSGFEQTTVRGALHCASGWTAPGLTWTGVPAAALLTRFPPPEGTVGVIAYAEYGYSTNLRVEDLLRDTTLLATGLDDAALAPEHGFPVRLVVPHLYAYKSPKWFRGWEYLLEPRRGFWEERGFHLIGDVWSEQRYSYLE